jgi:hypothetical protein
MRASKKPRAWRGASNTMVREISTWRREVSHQYPASWSLMVKGTGRRASQRCTNTLMVPGPSRLQMSCNAVGSAQEANPLDSSVKAMPALAACRLAHSWPLIQTLPG